MIFTGSFPEHCIGAWRVTRAIDGEECGVVELRADGTATLTDALPVGQDAAAPSPSLATTGSWELQATRPNAQGGWPVLVIRDFVLPAGAFAGAVTCWRICGATDADPKSMTAFDGGDVGYVWFEA